MIYMEVRNGQIIERYKFKNINKCLKFLNTAFGIIKHVIIKDTRISRNRKYTEVE